MNEEARKVLDELLKKEPAEFKRHEIEFLRARRSYLSAKQQEIYKKVLSAVVKPEKPVADTNRVSYKELQRKAKSLGYPYVGVKREDLEVAIATAEGPEYYKKT